MGSSVRLSRDPRIVTKDVRDLKSYAEHNISAECCMKSIESNNKANGCRFDDVDHFIKWARGLGWNRCNN
ncbi:hypothetical protein [Anaerorhabdus sp.]|uniref:hypothetical protein n=1 Tax=Anaerorhabdus sp. TaxID=1872524 RepID=UPI002FC7AB96